MARYIQDIYLNQPDDFVHFIMNDFLQKNGFTMSDWKGEAAYRAGDPMFADYKYLKWSYSNGMFHLEAWLRGTFGIESDLEGFVLFAQKRPYKNNLQQLITILQQPIPQTAGAPNTYATNVTRIPVQTVDTLKAATLGLVFGILSLVLCWSANFCIAFAVLGLSQCKIGSGSSRAGQAKAGKICCIIGLSITSVIHILYFGLCIHVVWLSFS